MRRLCYVSAAVLVAVFSASSVWAVDGQVPIPFTNPYATPVGIGTSGSYVVTRNLAPTGPGPVIEIECAAAAPEEAVTVDFNGFVADAAGNADPVVRIIGTPVCEVVLRNGEILHGAIGIEVIPPLRKLVVLDMEIVESGGEGILAPDTENFVIRRNEIIEPGTAGIVVPGAALKEGTIEDNLIRRTTDVGVFVEFGRSVEISNNRFFEIGTTAIEVLGNTSCLISQNTVASTSFRGINFVDRNTSCKIYNNLLENCPDAGIHLDAPSADNLILNNVVRGSAGDGIRIDGVQNHLDRNVSNSNVGYGIHLTPTSGGNSVGRNTAIGNGGPACGGVGVAPDYCDAPAASFSFGDNLFSGVTF